MKYLRNLAKKLAHKNKGKTLSQINRQQILIIILIIFFCVILVALSFSFDKRSSLIDPILFIIFSFFIGIIRMIYTLSFEYMLLDNLDVMLYQQYLTSTKKVRSITKIGILSYTSSLIQINYLKGDFQEMKTNLSTLHFEQPLKENAKQLKLFAYKMQYLESFFTKGKTNASDILNSIENLSCRDEQLKLRIINEIKALDDILVQGKVNDYFERTKCETNLRMLEYTYFNAKNAELEEKFDKVKALYAQIAQENDELFFVKEAKKYLDENCNAIN